MYIIISIVARCTSPAKDTGNKGFDSSPFSGSSAVTNNECMTGLFAKDLLRMLRPLAPRCSCSELGSTGLES